MSQIDISEETSDPYLEDVSSSLIDKFHANLSLLDQLENTSNILSSSTSTPHQKQQHHHTTTTDDHQLSIPGMIQSMQMTKVIALQIQDKLFFTTRSTLMMEDLSSEKQQQQLPTSISNFGKLNSSSANDDSTTIDTNLVRQELVKQIGIFTHCDSDRLEYVNASDNLFQSMKDQLKEYDGTAQSINTQFKDRNPIGFEFVLDHLRCRGKVKCLGIEKMNFQLLKSILKESLFFHTEKLTHHVQVLMKTHHRSEVVTMGNDADENDDDTIMKSCGGGGANTIVDSACFKQAIEQFENESTMQAQIIQKLSNEIANKFKSFMQEEETAKDEFFEGEDLAVNLNVSGLKFRIPFRILSQFENFIITKYIQSSLFKVGLDSHIFIDRNPEIFSLIYSYMMCGGKFNHFPAQMSSERKLQLKKEAEFYGLNSLVDEYLDEMRYPIELLSRDNIQMKERDDWLRKFFVKHRDSPILNDMYLTLSPLFEKLDEIKSGERFKIDFVKCPKLLDLTNRLKYSRHIQQPALVNSLETFKKNWFEFSQGLLEGLDWNGIFVAGGGVLGCLFKGDEMNPDQNTIVTEFLPFSDGNGRNFLKQDFHCRKDPNCELDEDSGFKYWKSSAQTNNNVAADKDAYHNFTAISNGSGTGGFNLGWSGLEWVRKRIADTKKHNKQNRTRTSNTKNKTTTTSKAANNSTTTTATNTTTMNNDEARFIPEPDIPTSFQKSDIDLFLYAVNEEEAEEKIKHIYQTIKGNLRKRIVRDFPSYQDPFQRYSDNDSTAENKYQIVKPNEIIDDDVIILRTQHAVTFYGYKTRPIQVVLRIYKSPAEVLLSFDVDSASVGFDGATVWSTDRCRRSLAHRVNLIDVDRQSTTYEYRLYKYAKRGFAVSVPGYHHSRVKNELLHFPRIFTFAKIQKNIRGLARLLLFEFACTSKNPKHILASYDDPNGVIAHLAEEKWSNNFIFDEKIRPSDYFNIALIKSNRIRPKMIYDSIQKARTVYNEKLTHVYENKHFFICTFNDIEDNFRYEKEPPCIHVPSYIKFITVEPGSQTPIGSFHPVFDNFFKIAYSKRIPTFKTKSSGSATVWFKSTFENKSKTGDGSFDTGSYGYSKDFTVSQYALLKDISGYRRDRRSSAWFESFPPETSAKIEHAFRLFLTRHSTAVECQVSEHEIVDFLSWSVRYGPYHPQFPNQSSILHRKDLSHYDDESSTNSKDSQDEKLGPTSVSVHTFY